MSIGKYEKIVINNFAIDFPYNLLFLLALKRIYISIFLFRL